MRKARRNPGAHLPQRTRIIPADEHGYSMDFYVHREGCGCKYVQRKDRSHRVIYHGNCPARTMPKSIWLALYEHNEISKSN